MMNTKFCRHTGNRPDPKLMLPTELFEQFHFGFPVHKRHPDPIGITVGSRTGGGQNWPALLGQNSIALPTVSRKPPVEAVHRPRRKLNNAARDPGWL
jgi:hypothetical protein